jgi:UDP:flavonoid glycosyltransferase YjiC (YdhE family)
MMPADAQSAWVAPDFYRELEGGKPVVHVTQGTVANETPQLIAPALAGLAGEDVLVVLTTGGRPIESLGLGTLPANARIGTFLSYPELLPKTSVMLTNGGYGGVQMALSHGVPLVVAGTSEDKPEVAARVAWSGAGINLKTATPTPEQVRRAVRAVLDDPRYRSRARDLAAEYARHDAVARGVELIEAAAVQSDHK